MPEHIPFREQWKATVGRLGVGKHRTVPCPAAVCWRNCLGTKTRRNRGPDMRKSARGQRRTTYKTHAIRLHTKFIKAAPPAAPPGTRILRPPHPTRPQTQTQNPLAENCLVLFGQAFGDIRSGAASLPWQCVRKARTPRRAPQPARAGGGRGDLAEALCGQSFL